MEITGNYTINNLNTSSINYVDMCINDVDEFNHLIRASSIHYNIVNTGKVNGKLKIHNLVFTKPPAGWEEPEIILDVEDGFFNGGENTTYECTLPAFLSDQEAYSAIEFIPNENENTGEINISWKTTYQYPVILPETYHLFYVDNETGYKRPILTVRPYTHEVIAP